ncbi:MAG: hypothetical protein AB1657_01220 [Candidatus Micrarchaeota archaeon]
MKRLLLLMFLLPLLFSQQPAEDAGRYIGGALAEREYAWLERLSGTGVCGPERIEGVFTPAFVMLLAISLATAILYMIGTLFDSPVLSALAKQEAYEIILTVVIVAAFFSIYGIIENVVVGTHGTSGGFISIASSYSKQMIVKISTDTSSLGFYNTLLYMYYTAPIRFGKMGAYSGISMNLGAVIRPVIDGVGSSATLLSVAMGEWLGNLSLLCFIQSVMMPVFFPLGILLRSVPHLRGGGNALIAFAFALFIVYPMMLAINYEAFERRYGDLTYGTPIQNAVSTFVAETGFGGVGLLAIGIKIITGTLLGPLLVLSTIIVFIETIKDIIYTVFVLSFFLGLLNIFVTLTFAKELARFLGTEINVSAFVKLI